MAATLQEARAALQARLVAYYAAGGESVQVYAVVPGAVVTPAVIVEPNAGDYHPSFGAAGAEHLLAVHVMAHLGDREAAQNMVDAMLSTSGSLSVIAAIHADKTLGGVVRWADPQRYRDYGTRDLGGTSYLMATIDVRVLCHP